MQKANYAVRMYEKVGFRIVDENEEEYIMVWELPKKQTIRDFRIVQREGNRI